MFTDGLVEARQHHELFGSERVATHLAASRRDAVDDVGATLVAAAREFHGRHELADDLAVLLLRVCDDEAFA
jgi:serine phosphatase RsbU (regulator of sigma subunit)